MPWPKAKGGGAKSGPVSVDVLAQATSDWELLGDDEVERARCDIPLVEGKHRVQDTEKSPLQPVMDRVPSMGSLSEGIRSPWRAKPHTGRAQGHKESKAGAGGMMMAAQAAAKVRLLWRSQRVLCRACLPNISSTCADDGRQHQVRRRGAGCGMSC